MKKHWASAAAIVVGAAIASGAGVRAEDGNADAAAACHRGGHLTLTREDGTTFRNVGDCVSYAALGGTLQPATSTASFTDIVLGACNALTVGYELGGAEYVIGSKPAACQTITLGGLNSAPFPSGTPVRVFLRDDTCGATYYSDDVGFHARVVGANPYEIDIADGGPGCSLQSLPWTGTGDGNLSLTLSVS